MSLKVKKIELSNWRNIESREIELSPEITIFLGKNATGKTNTVEAIELLMNGQTFRRAHTEQLIGPSQQQTTVKLFYEGDNRVCDVSLHIEDEKKIFYKNSKKCSAQKLSEFGGAVVFSPDDLSFIKGSSINRRREIDDFASMINGSYKKILRTYTKVVQQRNSLLKEGLVQKDLLESWNISLAQTGAKLLYHRYRLYKRLAEKIQPIYERITDGEKLSTEYISQVDIAHTTHSKEELFSLLYDKIQASTQEDIIRKRTLVGPHRDDMCFYISDMDAKTYASQGQQRSIALALKIAEVILAEEITGNLPLLMLDDVMSELDADRRHAILEFIAQGIQTIITTTHISYFSDDILQSAKIIEYGKDV